MTAVTTEPPGTGVTGWRFKRAEDIEVGDHAHLIINVPALVTAVHHETAQGSGVAIARFQIKHPYGGNAIFVARLMHEIVAVESKEKP